MPQRTSDFDYDLPDELIAHHPMAERTAAPPFVGRAAELGALAAAFATARDGDSVVVALTGASGIGKTALVRHYLASLEPGAALVLTGRCHQRETVPYPAIETMVDALANALAAMPAERAAASMPRDVAALARLFPALARVQAVATARALGRVPADPAELRRRAVTACAELIQRLAGDRLPVVFLDDMQWSNADTAGLLGELVRYFVGTGALFVLSSRPLDTPAAALPNDAGTPTVRLTDVAQPSGRSLHSRVSAASPSPSPAAAIANGSGRAATAASASSPRASSSSAASRRASTRRPRRRAPRRRRACLEGRPRRSLCGAAGEQAALLGGRPQETRAQVSCPDEPRLILASPARAARARGFLLDAQAPVLGPQASLLLGQAFDPRWSAR